MAFNRYFDEEIGRAAQLSCLNDGSNTYGLDLTDTTETLDDVAPGIYDVFLAGMSASATVLLRSGRASDPSRFSAWPGRAPWRPSSSSRRVPGG